MAPGWWRGPGGPLCGVRASERPCVRPGSRVSSLMCPSASALRSVSSPGRALVPSMSTAACLSSPAGDSKAAGVSGSLSAICHSPGSLPGSGRAGDFLLLPGRWASAREAPMSASGRCLSRGRGPAFLLGHQGGYPLLPRESRGWPPTFRKGGGDVSVASGWGGRYCLKVLCLPSGLASDVTSGCDFFSPQWGTCGQRGWEPNTVHHPRGPEVPPEHCDSDPSPVRRLSGWERRPVAGTQKRLLTPGQLSAQ